MLDTNLTAMVNGTTPTSSRPVGQTKGTKELRSGSVNTELLKQMNGSQNSPVVNGPNGTSLITPKTGSSKNSARPPTSSMHAQQNSTPLKVMEIIDEQSVGGVGAQQQSSFNATFLPTSSGLPCNSLTFAIYGGGHSVPSMPILT